MTRSLIEIKYEQTYNSSRLNCFDITPVTLQWQYCEHFSLNSFYFNNYLITEFFIISQLVCC